MSKIAPRAAPPDQLQREQALDPMRSVLVQAPAGSGKTTLLAERFLTLLGEVDEPGQVVAITFTIAAAAEMRNRILDELRATEPSPTARRVIDRSNAHGWKLLDLPAQLRISTIDSFCRELALQQPLLSGFGGGLAIADEPTQLYRRAARHTLEQIAEPSTEVGSAVETLLDWRDNNWHELEELLVEMLSKRDRWMQDFVLSSNPDWGALRARLERPFANAVRVTLTAAGELLDQVPGACAEALLLARFACSQPFGEQHRGLAELAEFPRSPHLGGESLESARHAFECLTNLVLTKDCTFRKRVDKNHGFPADRKLEKVRLAELIGRLNAVPGLESALAAVGELPPLRYAEEEWDIVRACFTLLRHAVGQLKVAFAESAAVDFIEVAQIAENVLKSDDGFPSDAALVIADGIRHLLVDEFQDTSRRQHRLLASLIAAWPDHESHTLFLVGDPMQSIYFFREADCELFSRVRDIGLEIPNADALIPHFVPLSANFRTTPQLVSRLNEVFAKIFSFEDGSGVQFSEAIPARESRLSGEMCFELHLTFAPQRPSTKAEGPPDSRPQEDAVEEQVGEIVDLIRSFQPALDEAREAGRKFRVAVLARARKSLTPIAAALHEAAIPFRAVDLERLGDRPEVLDVLALARALMNPQDRVAWLGVLRAPWCGLRLNDLHLLTSGDDETLPARPIPELLAERIPLLSQDGRNAAQRVLSALAFVPSIRITQPTVSLGTWLQQVWLNLGGFDCCDATARANLDLVWSCLDHLPAGEQDLLGPALDAALRKLTALPDPEASIDCGVQLMTIHKSKGLEFEIVIVPDLQAKDGATSQKMLSWLERGLTPVRGLNPDINESDTESADDITEFLIAPLPLKGMDKGKAKAWVDGEYKKREMQETRRILYVAATRAREELHLFARPEYKLETSGELSLASPSPGLLSTAWPALEEEIQGRFAEWKSRRRTIEIAHREDAGVEIGELAASAEGDLFVIPSVGRPTTKPTTLRRLPMDYGRMPDLTSARTPLWQGSDSSRVQQVPSLPQTKTAEFFVRHEGGMLSRALGTAVHAFLDKLARLRETHEWPAALEMLRQYKPGITAGIRETGIAPRQAEETAAKAFQLAVNASRDPAGQWILSPHPKAANEDRWSGVFAGSMRTVQADRVFRAGLTPLSEGDEAWWIVDYKTHAGDSNSDPANTAVQLRNLFAPQLEAYAFALRKLHGEEALVCAGLYYPRMLLLDWWTL